MHSGGWGFYEQQRGEGMDLVVVVVVVVWELGRDGGCRAANITLLPQSVLGAPPPHVCSARPLRRTDSCNPTPQEAKSSPQQFHATELWNRRPFREKEQSRRHSAESPV